MKTYIKEDSVHCKCNHKSIFSCFVKGQKGNVAGSANTRCAFYEFHHHKPCFLPPSQIKNIRKT